MSMKSTSEQIFFRLYKLAHDPTAPEPERETARRKMKAWLKRGADRKCGVAAPNEAEVGRAHLRQVKPPSD